MEHIDSEEKLQNATLNFEGYKLFVSLTYNAFAQSRLLQTIALLWVLTARLLLLVP